MTNKRSERAPGSPGGRGPCAPSPGIRHSALHRQKVRCICAYTRTHTNPLSLFAPARSPPHTASHWLLSDFWNLSNVFFLFFVSSYELRPLLINIIGGFPTGRLWKIQRPSRARINAWKIYNRFLQTAERIVPENIHAGVYQLIGSLNFLYIQGEAGHRGLCSCHYCMDIFYSLGNPLRSFAEYYIH